jgi:hypothetical protein
MKFQILVVSISTERKHELERQIKKLRLRNHVNIIYINAATPENSKQYLEGADKSSYNEICCALSHFYCLEMACLQSSPEFTLVLEDDVSFHKTDFLNVIYELIENWDTLVTPNQIVSIGWVPMGSRYKYNKLPVHSRLSYREDAKLITRHNWGTQGYLFRKQDIQQLTKDLLRPTFTELRSYIENYNKENDTNVCPITIDNMIFKILKQAIVFPPVLIERKVKSHLGHINWSHSWPYLFKKNDPHLKEYFPVSDSRITKLKKKLRGWITPLHV